MGRPYGLGFVIRSATRPFEAWAQVEGQPARRPRGPLCGRGAPPDEPGGDAGWILRGRLRQARGSAGPGGVRPSRRSGSLASVLAVVDRSPGGDDLALGGGGTSLARQGPGGRSLG